MLAFLKDRAGVSAVEYGLIAGLAAVVIISAVVMVGVDLGSTFQAAIMAR